MAHYELVALIAGALALAAAVVVAVLVRDRRPATPEPAAGLLTPEPSLDPPAGQTPGMIGALLDGEINQRNIKVTLVDLAARGYLRITALCDDHGHCYDWVLRRTAQPLGPELLVFETTLLTESFDPIGVGNRTSSSTTLSSVLAQPVGDAAEEELAGELRYRGWFAEEESRRTSSWGWVGAVVLLLGLLVTAFMLIDWLARGDFRGVLGGVMMIAAGILLASLGRHHGPHTVSGAQARAAASDYRRELGQLRPEDIEPAGASELFSRLLPWAVGFGNEDQLAKAFEDEQRRAANWGQHSELAVGWYVADQEWPERGLRELASEISGMVSQRPGGRARWRLASR